MGGFIPELKERHKAKKAREPRIILLGRTGSGKSETGNSILGVQRFKTSVDNQRRTLSCNFQECFRFNKLLSIVDIPGLGDRVIGKISHVQTAIQLLNENTQQNPNVFLYCIRMEYSSVDEIAALREYRDFLGEKMASYTIVVFTHHDIWNQADDEDGRTRYINEFIADLPNDLKTFVHKCRGKVFFENLIEGERRDEQVRELLSKIDKMIILNNSTDYTLPQSSILKQFRKIVTPEGIACVCIAAAIGIVGAYCMRKYM